MCGIAVSVDMTGRGRAAPWALDLMRHRGPDGEGVLRSRDGNVVMEHVRLAIIDPHNAEAAQPFVDRSGRWAIAYNGEVFNFRQLRDDLAARGVEFRTASDTEAVLTSFALDGEKVLERLRGMFAFVVLDRDSGEVFAARDQVGVKPLYYAVSGGFLVVASELRTILAHPAVHRELDPAAVVEYLAFGHTAGERTLVSGVRKLPPGHALQVRGGRVRTHEYWDVLPPDGPPVGPAEAPAELRRLLEEAVAASLVSDVPIGLMLSGGIDSSTVAALAARHADPSSMTAYTVAFGAPDDEAAAAACFASHLGLRHHVVPLSRDVLEASFDPWLASLDEPSSNPTWLAVSALADAVRSDGVKVLLSGDGGDELFGGYRRWMRYLRFHDAAWARTPPSLRRAAGGAVRPLTRGLARDIARRAAEGGELFVGSRPFHDDALSRVLGPAGLEAASAYPPEGRAALLRERFGRRLPGGDYLAWMSYSALKTSLVEDYLTRLDRMGMGRSVEGRVPLLDPELCRWAFRVPQDVKVGPYRQKELFRRAVRDVLPRGVLQRPKQGFCPPVAAWATGFLAGRVRTAAGPLVDGGLIDRREAAEVLSGRSAAGAFAGWTLGTLVAWCERNL